MMVKALLFDFDGTLLNTNTLIIETFRHVLEEYAPGKYTDEDYVRFIGPSLEQTFLAECPDCTTEMVHKYRMWNQAHHDTLVSEYPNVKETLEALHAQGIKLAIVTTKIRTTMERGLQLMGVAHLFDVTITLDDVDHPKPHAEPIEKALAQLGVCREEALMIGDNSHDIEGGKNAGVKTAGVAWSIKGEAFLRSLHPDYILHDMLDLLDIVKE